jgi:hypothetical protein
VSRSGAQSRLAQRRASAGGRASANAPSRKWPLRKIVAETMKEVAPGVSVPRDVLECGHMVPPAHDMIGRTYPASRRCRRCYEAEAQTNEKEV